MVQRIEEIVALNTEIKHFLSKEKDYERFLRENQAHKSRFQGSDLTLPDLDREAVAWYDTFEAVRMTIDPDGPIYSQLVRDHWAGGTGKRSKKPRPSSSQNLLDPLLPGSRRALLKMKKMDLYRKAQAILDDLPDIGSITKGELADRILDTTVS